jgi:hypothetical protein
MRSTHVIRAIRGVTAIVHPKQDILKARAGGRGAKLAAGLAVAFLIVLVPVADAVLDPTDTATGDGALASENGGSFNTADGYLALNANTTGFRNTAAGALALVDNSTGSDNTAAGAAALLMNKTGSSNTAAGLLALSENKTGSDNTAAGVDALQFNTTGNHNTAAGKEALLKNTVGGGNTAIGFDALSANDVGFGNTAVGQLAGVTASAANANTTGSGNTFLGFSAGPGTPFQLSNATAIGANALVSESNALVLGASDAKVGIGTAGPASLLQVGVPSTSYGDYLQIPMVTTDFSPPARACDASTFVGRIVLQYDPRRVRTTLWSCSAAGAWTKLAQG